MESLPASNSSSNFGQKKLESILVNSGRDLKFLCTEEVKAKSKCVTSESSHQSAAQVYKEKCNSILQATLKHHDCTQ